MSFSELRVRAVLANSQVLFIFACFAFLVYVFPFCICCIFCFSFERIQFVFLYFLYSLLFFIYLVLFHLHVFHFLYFFSNFRQPSIAKNQQASRDVEFGKEARKCYHFSWKEKILEQKYKLSIQKIL